MHHIYCACGTIICISWKYPRSVDIICISWKYPRPVDMIRILWIYMYYVDTIHISWKYLCSVDIIILFTGNGTRIQSIERLWSCNKRKIIFVCSRPILSVLNRISPSDIDSTVKKFRSVIVRNVYNFCTI